MDRSDASEIYPWKFLQEETILDSTFMKLIARDFQRLDRAGDTAKHRFFLLQSRDWINVLPVTAQGSVVMVKQVRMGISAPTWEVPGGVLDSSDTEPKMGGLRELAEETGYSPSPSAQAVSLGWSYANPAIQNNRVHFLAVAPVCRTSEQKLDQGESIEVREFTPLEIDAALKSETLTHPFTLLAFWHLQRKAESRLSADSAGQPLLLRALQALARGELT